MKIGVLGTGMVGQTIGRKLVELGHEVMMGSRSEGNEKAVAWVEEVGQRASQGDFAQAASFGKQIWNCTAGMHAESVFEQAGAQNAEGKIVIDLSNPLDFSQGMPPQLGVVNDDSVGEQIQRALPGAKVVKTLNTVSCEIMVEPGKLDGTHDMFICGEDAEAKAQVTRFLRESFGWEVVHDLGGIDKSRGLECYLPLWLRMWQAFGTADFNIHIVKGS